MGKMTTLQEVWLTKEARTAYEDALRVLDEQTQIYEASKKHLQAVKMLAEKSSRANDLKNVYSKRKVDLATFNQDLLKDDTAMLKDTKDDMARQSIEAEKQ